MGIIKGHFFPEKRIPMMIFHKRKNKAAGRKPVFQIQYLIIVSFTILILYYLYRYNMVYQNEQLEKNQIHLIETKLYQEDLPNLNEKLQSVPSKEAGIKNTQNIQESANHDPDDKKEVWKGDCILFIPTINLEKIVYTGSNRMEHLNQYELTTAADNMQYKNGGNYIICGHASRLYGHSLNRIKEVKEGNLLYIQTKSRLDEYIVKKVFFADMNQTSKYCNQTSRKTITILSCAKYISKDSYIVIQAELK